jgi:hypothetical protein
MFVNAGFIVGFDSERGAVADAMVECIEATSIPACMVGLLYALPTTQLTRRLEREGRLFPFDYTMRLATEQDAGDQCAGGLNFDTARPRRDVLLDYRTILERIYRPAAYYARVRMIVRMLDRPTLDRSSDPDPRQLANAARDLTLLWRLVWRIALRQPRTFWHFAKVFYECVSKNPRALPCMGLFAAMYLDLGPFSRYVMSVIDRQIADIDSGTWQRPLVDDSIARGRVLAETVSD